MTELKVKLIHPTAKPPSRATDESAGFDLFAAETIVIPATHSLPDGHAEVGRALVPTGIAIEVPKGTVGRLASRSGLSTNANLEVGAGWIDSDYRGSIMVELKNFSSMPHTITQGERIAQLIIIPLVDVEITVVPELSDTKRGSSGFGSTGP